MVSRLFAEADAGGTGRLSADDVVAWVGARFRVDAVVVPGQSLDRGEIDAVRARLDKIHAARTDGPAA